MDSTEAQRLRSLERENADLKKLLAEAHLDISALKVAFGVNKIIMAQTATAWSKHIRFKSTD